MNSIILNFDKCKVCSFNGRIKDLMDSAFEKHYNLCQSELYKLLLDLYNHHKTDLKNQNMHTVDLTLEDVKFHYSNCKISKKNTLLNDIRQINTYQKQLGNTIKDINMWLKLNQHKSTLINQLEDKSPDYEIEPFAFN